jgi:hypothetical protein
MDRTLINLASILLGGAGLFAVLTGFNVPEASASFYGSNPFLIKREAIKETSDRMFLLVALLPFLLQIGAEIAGDNLHARLHDVRVYIVLAAAGLLLVLAGVWILARVSRRLARRKWLPRVLEGQGDLVEQAAFIVSNDGFRREEYPHISEYSEALKEERRIVNYQKAEEYISQVERLFEVRPVGTLAERIETMRHEIPKPAPDPAPKPIALEVRTK